MYQVIKRDGKKAEFNISKISEAITKAFEAQEKQYHPSIIDMLALKVTADFESKIKDGFILKEMAGSWVVVPLGEKLVNFEMMMTLNETGAFLWEQLKEDKTEEDLVAALLAEYNVEKEVAAKDVSEFVQKLKEKEVL